MLILDKLPEGWKFSIASANCAPNGYKLATNGKSRFSGEYKSAWVKIPKEQRNI